MPECRFIRRRGIGRIKMLAALTREKYLYERDDYNEILNKIIKIVKMGQIYVDEFLEEINQESIPVDGDWNNPTKVDFYNWIDRNENLFMSCKRSISELVSKDKDFLLLDEDSSDGSRQFKIILDNINEIEY